MYIYVIAPKKNGELQKGREKNVLFLMARSLWSRISLRALKEVRISRAHIFQLGIREDKIYFVYGLYNAAVSSEA
jgi:hypothetical protein